MSHRQPPAANFIFWLFFALTAVVAGWTKPAAAQTWRVALIGDTPYSNYERAELPKMLKSITDHHVDLIAHIGDFKHGGDRCDDALFEDRFRLFETSRAPLLFVPGDNEWSDCNRPSNGAYDPLERLARLRELFWQDAQTLGRRKLGLERQPGQFPEHARLGIGPVLFVTLNIPGGDNNFSKDGEPSEEYLVRNPAVIDWLRDSFALARHDKLAGIALLFQANPGFTNLAMGVPLPGYRQLLDVLRVETLNFPGQVLVVHGDSHINRIDQPLRDTHGKLVRNLTRLETFGYPLMGWTLAVIDSESPGLFRFETHPWPVSLP